MIARLRDLFFTPHPYERNVLLCLAAFRAAFTGTAAVTVWVWTWDLPLASPVMAFGARGVLTLLAAIVASVVSADFIEHWLTKALLHYTHNPRVMAGGQWERYNGALSLNPHLLAIWENHKYDMLHFIVKPADVPHLLALGYPAPVGSYFRCVWEGDPGSGRFGDE